MNPSPIHNPDRYMVDLRQILSQGRKRIGILIGAGAPTAIRVDANDQLAEGGRPLIPDVAGLTETVIEALDENDRNVIEPLKCDIDGIITIETVLTQIRRLAQAIGTSRVHGLDGTAYSELGQRLCEEIGRQVNVRLPSPPNPYSELVSWISGTQRDHAVEVFTPNYDLLLEEAFERARIAYFDGFTGAHRPFFDPASVSSDELPARWARLWKLHGSLGWKISDNAVIRTGGREATELIYPNHLKYDQVTRLPYSALFEKLRQFLTTPDTLLICSGFSFLDSHICAVLDEALAANAHTAIFAFQYKSLDKERPATQLAFSRPNMSVYARDGAVINGVQGDWQPGPPPSEDWREIRRTFWDSTSGDMSDRFLLGDFAILARFLALTQAQFPTPEPDQEEDSEQLGVGSDSGTRSDA